jgi:nitroimidazol reductase NimA-like FMN-containing flavoprotein (pyridoxamine 5'-phosphate oxidase superfamily)
LRPPDRIRVKREPERGRYDRQTIDAILDEALICHLGFAVDGQPYVIPTLHARVGDEVLIHGSSASRALKTIAAGAPVCLTATLIDGRALRHLDSGAPVCVTVTLFDGLVLAKSVFNHSVNYRSVVVFGTARTVPADEKRTALRALTEQLAPGRWDEVRQPTDQELKATWILALPIEEASAKVRTGGPSEEPEDEDLPIWSGVVPVHLEAGPSEYDWRRVQDGRLGPPRG